MRRWLSGALCASLAVAGVLGLSGARTLADSPLPVSYSQSDALRYALAHNNGAPPGANDWTCRPSRAHPRPVILVHGSLANMAINWFTLSPLLVNAGYCVFALNYGQQASHPVGYPGAVPAGATAAIPQSAKEFARFVARVRKATGAAKVDIVGHSQGGLMPRYYLAELGGGRYVHSLIGLAPPNHGHTPEDDPQSQASAAALSVLGGQAARDEAAGSRFLAELNVHGDTVPGVKYTVIASRDDTVVTPYTSAFLDGPEVQNILLQDRCPKLTVSHGGLAYDRYTLGLVQRALDPGVTAPQCPSGDG